MPPQTSSFKGFDIVCRPGDGSWAVYDYGWWPDPYLDNDLEANEYWLEATGGWRSKGWQVVAVMPSYQAARTWAYNNTGG